MMRVLLTPLLGALLPILAHGQDPKEVTVQAPIGPITGVGVYAGPDDDFDNAYFAFRGIPYAEAPVGQLRFKDPVAKSPWNEPINATEYGNICPQFQRGIIQGDEDCLFLNIFTPRLPSGTGEGVPDSSLAPVMVYIHGGAYLFGSGNQEGWTLTDHEVLLVTLNYRLSSLGFLSLGKSVIPGNLGLKDQIEALQWIRRNIKSFGGDPARVTVMGQSAGGVAAHLHQLSPQGRGLFQGVIAQSGSALMNTFQAYAGKTHRLSMKFVEELGCADDNVYSTLECLQAKPVEELVTGQHYTSSFQSHLELAEEGESLFHFEPVVDSFARKPYMPELPLQRLQSGAYNRVPSILGVVGNEGGFFSSLQWDSLEAINTNWTEFANGLLFDEDEGPPREEQVIISKVMQKFYSGGGNITQENIQALSTFYTDVLFERPAAKSASLQCGNPHAPVYFYALTEKPSESFTQFFTYGTTAQDQDWGVAHKDDLLFLFGKQNGLDGLQTEQTKATASHMRTLWTNFAKYQDPSPYHDSDLPVWLAFSCTGKEYLELKAEPEMKQDLNMARSYFWDTIYYAELERRLKEKTLPSMYQPEVKQREGYPLFVTPAGTTNLHYSEQPMISVYYYGGRPYYTYYYKKQK